MPYKKTSRKKRVFKNTKDKQNFFVASATFFVVIVAALLVAAFAATTPALTLGHQSFSLSNVRAKKYPQVFLSTIASTATTTVDTSTSCRDAFHAEPKISTDYQYFCWRGSDASGGWTPQGITGSGSAESTADGGNKNILLASWYTTGKPTLTASTQTASGSESASRITVVNMKTKKYWHIELAKPCAQSALQVCKLNSHVGGIAWAGNYIYAASTSGMYVFNVNDIFKVNGKPVMVASEWYNMQTSGSPVSSVSFDNSANQLVTAEYHAASTKKPSHIARWNLDSAHHLSVASTIKSASVFTINAYSVQGAASYKGAYIAHSSSEKAPGSVRYGGTLLKWRKPSSLGRDRMPYHMESAYYDSTNKRAWAVTEGGSHTSRLFVLSYPSSVAF